MVVAFRTKAETVRPPRPCTVIDAFASHSHTGPPPDARGSRHGRSAPAARDHAQLERGRFNVQRQLGHPTPALQARLERKLRH
jgi:hypothetical protein